MSLAHARASIVCTSAALLLSLGPLVVPAYSLDEPSDTVQLQDLSLEDLLNVKVLTVSKSAERQVDAPGVVSVVTRDELQRFGGNTLYDILLRVPSLSPVGIYMTDRAALAARGDQVGGSTAHILLLIDGRPVREAIEGGIKSAILKAFPAEVIDRIEVIRGPGSVLYGSNAFSAVINVITVRADRTGAAVSGLAGTRGTVGGSGVFTAAGESGLGLVLAGRLQQRDDWETTMLDGVEIAVPDDARGAYGRVTFKGFRGMFSIDRWEHFYAAPHRHGSYPHPYGTAKWEKRFADLGYSHALGDKITLDFNTTYSQSLFEVDYFPNTSRDSRDVTLELTGRYSPADKLNLLAGALYNHVDGVERPTGGGTPTTDASKNMTAGYLQGDWRPNDTVKLIAGVQANRPEDIDADWNPRVGVVVRLQDRLTIKALYAEAFRAPSLNEYFIDFRTLQGNPDLRPEKVRTLDLGVNYLGDKVQVGLNGFYSRQRDIIVQAGAAAEQRRYENIGEVSFSGVELDSKVYVSRDVFASLSLLYQANEDGEGDENVTPIPNLGVKAGLSYSAPNGLTASVFGIYQGAPDDKYSSAAVNLQSPAAKAFTMLNAHLAYDLEQAVDPGIAKRLLLFAELENILDEEIWLPAAGAPEGFTLPYHQGFVFRAGLRGDF